MYLWLPAPPPPPPAALGCNCRTPGKARVSDGQDVGRNRKRTEVNYLRDAQSGRRWADLKDHRLFGVDRKSERGNRWSDQAKR
ncbi:hypothetical protein KFK09_010880 [Dendrobium nobile]|uniref:Uncharacterized protein n=1 Tax=Dendrobium nobile TaxID=94219 RepID=A0A8T3BB57_DENNO|nr:hypothetical protein KFK09_010880 [Dendrobium nobile]